MPKIDFELNIIRFWLSSVLDFWLCIYSWLGHRDPKKIQRTRSLIHTSDRSESNSKYLILQTKQLFSLDNIFVLITLITLSIVHITWIFISTCQSHYKLNKDAVLLCKNISESILHVLWITYWWDFRAICRQYFEMLDGN